MKTKIVYQVIFMISFILSSIVLHAGSSMKKVESSLAAVKNVVLVHGAFADGSGFKDMYHILSARGYNVTIVQNPLTSLDDDVAATWRILDRQDGPVVLVGHSWGGAVITEAGMHPKVVALVYVAAFQPGQGESTGQWISKFPIAPENGILAPDSKGVVYYDDAKYHTGFAGDLSIDDAAFLSASQGPIYAKCFSAVLKQAAWKTKPTYGIVATDDKSINPDMLRAMYKRSGTKVTELTGSHLVFISRPKEVTEIVLTAIAAVSK